MHDSPYQIQICAWACLIPQSAQIAGAGKALMKGAGSFSVRSAMCGWKRAAMAHR